MQFPCERQGWVSSSNHWIGNKIFCSVMYYITLYIEPGSPLWIGKNAAVAIQRWPGWPRFPTGNQRGAACTSKVAQHQASYPSSSSSFSWEEDHHPSSRPFCWKAPPFDPISTKSNGTHCIVRTLDEAPMCSSTAWLYGWVKKYCFLVLTCPDLSHQLNSDYFMF